MATLKVIIEELQFLSDRISTQIRTIAASIIALVWALLVVGKESTLSLDLSTRQNLAIVGMLALVGMFLDFLQYFFGYIYTNHLQITLVKDGKDEGNYNYNDWRYRLRNFFFWIKQVIILIAVVWLCIIISLIYLLR